MNALTKRMCRVLRHFWRDTGRRQYGIKTEQRCAVCGEHRHRRIAPWDYESWEAWHAGPHPITKAEKAKGGVCKPTSTNAGS